MSEMNEFLRRLEDEWNSEESENPNSGSAWDGILMARELIRNAVKATDMSPGKLLSETPIATTIIINLALMTGLSLEFCQGLFIGVLAEMIAE